MEEHATSMFYVEELFKTEMTRCSEVLMNIYWTAWQHIPEKNNLQSNMFAECMMFRIYSKIKEI
jgi:hypothetical protein